LPASTFGTAFLNRLILAVPLPVTVPDLRDRGDETCDYCRRLRVRLDFWPTRGARIGRRTVVRFLLQCVLLEFAGSIYVAAAVKAT
jgi:hypothetical protein